MHTIHYNKCKLIHYKHISVIYEYGKTKDNCCVFAACGVLQNAK